MTVKSCVLAACPPMLRPWWDRLEASPIGYRLAKGAFWSLAGAVISRALGLLSSILVARMLGKTGYGELGMIQSTIGMFGVFAGFGLGVTATKHVAEFRAKDPSKAGRIIALSGLVAIGTGGVMALALFLFAPWLADHTLAAPQLAGLVRIGSLLLFLSALNGSQTGALAGFEAFRAIAKINLIAGAATFPLMVGGVWLWGTTGAVWALVLSMALNWFLNHLALRLETVRHTVPFTLSGCTREWPVLWRFSFPAVLAGALSGPTTWMATALLVNQPAGYAEMGVYNVTNQWKTAILFLPGTVAAIVLPILSTLTSTRTHHLRVVWLNMVIITTIALFGAVPIMVFAPQILGAYGAEYRTGILVLNLQAATAVLMAANSVVAQALVSQGTLWTGLAFNVLWSVVFLAGAYLLIPENGAAGLALAMLVAYCFHTLWQGAFVVWMSKREHINT